MARTYDAVVVGAGPAGLAAAATLTSRGLATLLLEQGKARRDRDRDAPVDILSGVGGAGLFSDGKHSFFPSASALWTLPRADVLHAAYVETAALLARHHVEAPPLALGAAARVESADGWRTKRYPSIYASRDQRAACTDELLAVAGEAWCDARVVAARREAGVTSERDGARFLLDVERAGSREVVRCTRLVVAGGRLAPRWMRAWLEPLGVRYAFGRLEVGVRIEVASTSPLFQELRGVDPKLTSALPDGTEVRTFCVCRDGEVVVGEACGVRAVSGRADGPATGRSNVGVLARVQVAAFAHEIAQHAFAAQTFCVPLGDLLRPVLPVHEPAELTPSERTPRGTAPPDLVAAFGDRGGTIVGAALRRFAERFPSIRDDASAVAWGPCLEGAGDYPVSSDDLRIAPSVWIAGDASGRFRGIVASLVSGRYVGALAAEEARSMRA